MNFKFLHKNSGTANAKEDKASLDQTTAKQHHDFLIGNADQYKGIVEEDFAKLKADLDEANECDSNVVLTIFSLPGNRWRQFNNNQKDDRIWQDFSYHEQTAQFWQDLAGRVKDHPAINGYNLITERYPETATGFNHFCTEDYHARYSKFENTAADLNKLYETIVQAIRTVDADTPIIVNVGVDPIPCAFQYMKPIQDDRVFYAFHMYEPYQMTHQNPRKGYTYELVTIREKYMEKLFNKEMLQPVLKSIEEWAKEHNVSGDHILIKEFGFNQIVQSTDQYLLEVINVL